MALTTVNFHTVGRILGRMLLIEAAMLLLPALVCLIYNEQDYLIFLLCAGFCLVPALIMGRGKRGHLRKRETFLLTTLSWVLFSAFGMLPLILSPSCSLSVADAFFETMSGFTTTGATVITDVDACSHGILFWRSEIQWLGGLGIILFTLALLPVLNRAEGLWMFNTETTGITHDKIHPRIGRTVHSLWLIYASLTTACTLLLWAGPMTFFDSLCISMSALSTGGFATHTAGLFYWNSGYVNAVLAVFMFLGGVNFILIYWLIHGRPGKLWHNDVFRCYSLILLIALAVTSLEVALHGRGHGVRQLLIDPLCQLSSAFTSTGYTSMDFSATGPAVLMVIMALMAIGACAGSTTGGLKVDRFMALTKNMRRESVRALFPRRIMAVGVNNDMLDNASMSKIHAFATIYLLLCVGGTLFATFWDLPVLDCFFGTLSCLSNNGLGYGICAGGYGVFPDPVKWVMSLLMMAGRLELFSVIVLFLPQFWLRH